MQEKILTVLKRLPPPFWFILGGGLILACIVSFTLSEVGKRVSNAPAPPKYPIYSSKKPLHMKDKSIQLHGGWYSKRGVTEMAVEFYDNDRFVMLITDSTRNINRLYASGEYLVLPNKRLLLSQRSEYGFPNGREQGKYRYFSMDVAETFYDYALGSKSLRLRLRPDKNTPANLKALLETVADEQGRITLRKLTGVQFKRYAR